MNDVQSHSHPESILIVDDTPDNLRLLSMMLTQQGYEVRSALSGSIALTTMRAALPDLILLDIAMPNLNGYDVCQQLKADDLTREIPVIFLSAFNETADKVRGFQVGGADYITKPFQLEEVLARVKNQLDLRRMQRELQQARAEALRALDQERELNRLKSEFVSMISHDFRTPLTSIQGFAGLLRPSAGTIPVTLQEHYFDKIDLAIDHLLHLLDEILLLGSLDANKLTCHPTPLNLQQFCQDLIESLQLSTQPQHRIHLSYGCDRPSLELDQTLLWQILSNLLSNAIKYSPEGKDVHLRVSCQDTTMTFEVQDQGIGIPLNSQARLFDPFYRSSNVGQIKGTGLGLTIVKKCVEAYQGAIAVTSIEGRGTTVTVTLPLKDSQQV